MGRGKRLSKVISSGPEKNPDWDNFSQNSSNVFLINFKIIPSGYRVKLAEDFNANDSPFLR